MRTAIIDSLDSRSSLALAQFAEESGFDEYWVTEHHSDWQCPNPRLLAAAIASSTTRIRIGMGAVLARMHPPFAVAEDFAFLDRLYPDRLCFGLASAVPSPGLQQQLNPSSAASFGDSILKIADAYRKLAPHDDADPLSKLWICGTSPDSVDITRRVGGNFAFHHYLCPRPNSEKASILRAFRKQASSGQELAIAVYGICCSSKSRARSLWNETKNIERGEPSFLGDRSICLEQIHAITSEFAPDVLLVQTLCSDWNLRLESYSHLAEILKEI